MKSFCLTIKDNIATIIFDQQESKFNKFNEKNILELDEILNELATKKDIEQLIIASGKENSFIVGADISEINNISNKKQAKEVSLFGQKVFQKISDFPFVTVAFINGFCMGGGTEIALACDFRIAVDITNTKIALPEVKLGILPGFGGTQRLPRINGLINSLKIISTGKNYDAIQSRKISLIDFVIEDSNKDKELKDICAKLLNSSFRKKVIRSRKKSIPFIEKIPFTKNLIINSFLKKIPSKIKDNYPAIKSIVEVLCKSSKGKITSSGFELEAEHFSNLAITQVSKNLISLYFTNEELKKQYQKTDFKLEEVAVVGAGIMGGDIAFLFNKRKIKGNVIDINEDALGKVLDHIKNIYSKIKKYTIGEVEENLTLLKTHTSLKNLANEKLVIEAVIEDEKIKKDIFKECEDNLSQDAIIASNTSSIPIETLAKDYKYSNRFIGIHFFNPASRMPLVEIIPHSNTSEDTIIKAFNIVKSIGKIPIVVGDGQGFLVNRLLMPYLNEAIYILDEIKDIERIDNIFNKFFMPMGPLELIDVIGIDTSYKVCKILEQAFSKRMKSSSLLEKIANNKSLLGKKNSNGFYLYDGKEKVVNQEVLNMCSNDSNTNNISDEEILNRCLLAMINEACYCLEEKIINKANFLDMAMILGIGFPSFKGGILKYADNDMGIDKVKSLLQELANKYDRFEVSNFLKSKKTIFYHDS